VAEEEEREAGEARDGTQKGLKGPASQGGRDLAVISSGRGWDLLVEQVGLPSGSVSMQYVGPVVVLRGGDGGVV